MAEETKKTSARDVVGELRRQILEESTTKWQLEAQSIIKDISRSMGWDYIITKQKDKDGNITITMKTFKIIENALINERGVTAVIMSLSKIVNKNTFLSNMTSKECMFILVDHMFALIDDLAMNLEYYGIDSVATLEKIRSATENMSEIALYRGRDGATMDFLKTVQKTLERITTGDEPRTKKKWF